MNAGYTVNQENRISHTRAIWLDILRITLCIGVLISHYIPSHGSLIAPWAVDGFFVLSGYFLAKFFQGMREKGGMDVYAFYEAKARRLLPTFIVGLSIGVMVTLAYHVQHGNKYPIFPTWKDGHYGLHMLVSFYNGPMWYMVSEIAFICMAPFLFWIFNKGKWALGLTVSLSLVYSCILYLNIPLDTSFTCNGLYLQPQTRFWEFTGGMFAWVLLSQVPFTAWMKNVTITIFVATTCAFSILFTLNPKVVTPGINFFFLYDVGVITTFMLLIPFLGKINSKLPARLHNCILYLSMLTYPMYMYHFPILKLIGGISAACSPNVPYPLIVGGAFLVTVMLSVATQHCFKKLYYAGLNLLDFSSGSAA